MEKTASFSISKKFCLRHLLLSKQRIVSEVINSVVKAITAKAGGEKLFGSISNIDIAAALEAAGQVVDRKFITSGIVKRTGKYSASR